MGAYLHSILMFCLVAFIVFSICLVVVAVVVAAVVVANANNNNNNNNLPICQPLECWCCFVCSWTIRLFWMHMLRHVFNVTWIGLTLFYWGGWSGACNHPTGTRTGLLRWVPLLLHASLMSPRSEREWLYTRIGMLQNYQASRILVKLILSLATWYILRWGRLNLFCSKSHGSFCHLPPPKMYENVVFLAEHGPRERPHKVRPEGIFGRIACRQLGGRWSKSDVTMGLPASTLKFVLDVCVSDYWYWIIDHNIVFRVKIHMLLHTFVVVAVCLLDTCCVESRLRQFIKHNLPLAQVKVLRINLCLGIPLWIFSSCGRIRKISCILV